MKNFRKTYFFIFILALFLGGVTLLFAPERDFSENENRYLEKLPEISLSEYVKGDLQDSFEKASTDQFPGRDMLTAMSTGLYRLAGLKDVGGVYLGKDHYYIEKKLSKDISLSRYDKNINAVKEFSDKYGHTSILLVPSAGSVLSDKLPNFAPMYDADKLYSATEKLEGMIDTRDALTQAAKEKQIYYKTDHHWTYLGAETAYRDFMKAKGLPIEKEPSYEKLTDSFYGTTYSKALDGGAVPDEIYAPKVSDELTVTIDGKQAELYDKAKLTTKDKYAAFFGGNFAEVRLHNPASTTDKSLVVFKDSYANSFVPLLTDTYRDITMIDLRYETTPVSTILPSLDADEYLFLYEISTFAESGEVGRVLL